MKLKLSLLVLLAVLVAPAAFGDVFTLQPLGPGSVTLYNPANPNAGLGVNWAPVNNAPLTFNLNPGDSQTFDLFYLWTDETAVNVSDDLNPENISVNFNFNPPPSSGSVNGTTAGVVNFCVPFLGCALQYGNVHWNQPTLVNFGSGGQYTVELSDANFNCCLPYGTLPGEKFGATIQATVTYDSAPAVPEPSSLIMLGSGLLGAAGIVRRKLNR